MYKNLPIFQNSVRVFFPLAALIAVLVPMFTVTMIVNNYGAPPSLLSFYEWHGFEMLFCFFHTLIIGFILTAGAHWTGKKPINGGALIFLLLLWINEQVAINFAGSKIYLLCSVAALALYHLHLTHKTLRGYRLRSFFFVTISIYLVCKLLYTYGAINRGFTYKNEIYDFAIWVLVFLTSIVSIRIIPVFTKNFFKLSSVPQAPLKVKNLFIITLSLVPLVELTGHQFLTSLIYALTGALGLTNSLYWKPITSLKKPILGMLHLGFIILNISLLTKAASFYFDSLNLTRASLHLILTGGISILALNIMVRATLGHTGRKIALNKTIAIMYASIIIGLLIRFLVPIINIDLFHKSLHHSMGMWTLAFLIYLIRFIPYVFQKRADQ